MSRFILGEPCEQRNLSDFERLIMKFDSRPIELLSSRYVIRVTEVHLNLQRGRDNVKFAKLHALPRFPPPYDLWKCLCTAEQHAALYRTSLHNYFISQIYRVPSAFFAWRILAAVSPSNFHHSILATAVVRSEER